MLNVRTGSTNTRRKLRGAGMISILCPTRKRPSNVVRLYDSIMRTVSNPEDVELVLYIDEDDSETINLMEELPVMYYIGPRILLSSTWNKCYEVSSGDVLMHGGDDIVFRTEGWDGLIKEAFNEYPDKILFAYGRDGYSPDDFGTHGFIHKKWVETIGYFVPPYFSSDYNDTWLNDVAKMIGRHKFLPEIYTEHMHPVNGKAGWDETHLQRLERGKQDDVAKIYADLLEERVKDAEKLRKVMR